MLLPLALVMLFGGAAQGADVSIQPSDKLALLQIPGTVLLNPHISPDGRFVYANAAFLNMEKYLDGYHAVHSAFYAKQFLWRLDDNSFQAPLNELPYDHLIEFESFPWGPMAAFSPDSQYLALWNKKTMALFSLAEMKISRSLTFSDDSLTSQPNYTHLQWSPDSRFVATLEYEGILVWDIVTNATYRHPLPLNQVHQQPNNLIATDLS